MFDLNSLTLDEKLTLLTGKDCWRTESLGGKLPEIFMSDGPHGLRTMTEDWKTLPATARKPSSVTSISCSLPA